MPGFIPNKKEAANSPAWKPESPGVTSYVNALYSCAQFFSPTDAVKDRARHHNIQIVGADRFSRIQPDLRQWMKTGQFPTATG
jgi:hypothetical protein